MHGLAVVAVRFRALWRSRALPGRAPAIAGFTRLRAALAPGPSLRLRGEGAGVERKLELERKDQLEHGRTVPGSDPDR